MIVVSVVPRVIHSTVETQTVLEGLVQYQNYTVQIGAATRVGEGVLSKPILCRTKEDGRSHNL